MYSVHGTYVHKQRDYMATVYTLSLNEMSVFIVAVFTWGFCQTVCCYRDHAIVFEQIFRLAKNRNNAFASQGGRHMH